MTEEDAPILIRKAENTRNHSDHKDAEYVIIETEQEKQYLQWLRDKEIYSRKGLLSRLIGMREYQEWNELT